MSLLCLLYMSSAFDCVDHALLLKKLKLSFGISRTALKWFESYLIGCTHQVVFNDILSSVEVMSYGVPQGSVLGPLLFLLYTSDVFKIIEEYDFKYHAFADDLQIFANCLFSNFDDLVDRMRCCLSSDDGWMTRHGLKLNQCKTLFLPIGTWQQVSRINFKPIKINDSVIHFCTSARSIHVFFYTNMSMHTHIKSLSSECRYQL